MACGDAQRAGKVGERIGQDGQRWSDSLNQQTRQSGSGDLGDGARALNSAVGGRQVVGVYHMGHVCEAGDLEEHTSDAGQERDKRQAVEPTASRREAATGIIASSTARTRSAGIMRSPVLAAPPASGRPAARTAGSATSPPSPRHHLRPVPTCRVSAATSGSATAVTCRPDKGQGLADPVPAKGAMPAYQADRWISHPRKRPNGQNQSSHIRTMPKIFLMGKRG